MTAELMPEPEGPADERFVYVVTAAGVQAVRTGAEVVDSEREAGMITLDVSHPGADD
jgi:hypothetical protein